ncbi:amino acid/amide ABC transporter substrate-binding protein (HAAT family) [Hydrogenoanaerobacterium saccharovorans]|uniref:Amino acid/amide ABC transporter substrate-binding protein, HAAT family n=1 Tax=Hydrogenoanaerobacterium saccharovorans TaxID=474960 RepID=A0A1H7YRL5_9FIRM|nr:ABC transporter substrate-binding protein [Hydrogenoanaerobacterium saccharovorans]RPF49100.1 amino acid/amide ABC transporter substrate-binding protein (HAAT family) [Hydrogenoanaerobacterium saccharovorans]SEM47849.1 amino acid/amide ABC transporter substrate-binding protein, HAAT family [Hydrogenoanaerobacterium saccharovorans]
MKKLLAMALATVIAAGMVTGCASKSNSSDGSATGSSAPASGEALKLGVLAPLTGEVSVYGVAAKNGIELAIEEINKAGGILGSQIELMIEDEKGDVSEAVNGYNKLMSKGMVALLGDVTSKPTMAVAELAAADGLPMITATGTALPITTYGPNVFRTCFTDPFQGRIMAKFAAENLKAKNIAIIYNTSDDYSTGLVAAFEEMAASKGVNIAIKEAYGADDKDFKSQLTKIASTKPDALFVPDYYTKVALIASQAREVGFTGPMLGADGWDGVLGTLDDANKSVVNGSYISNHYSAQDTDEKVAGFVKAYTEKYGETPNAFAALGYDAAYMMTQAITTAGSTDAQAIVDAMKAIQFKGVTGNITFDENNNPIKDATILKLMDGEANFDSKVTAE